MTENTKTGKTVTRLIQRTQDDLLTWEAKPTSEDIAESDESVVGAVYVTETSGRNLRLYHYKSRLYSDDVEWEWVHGVALELEDRDNLSWWRFPEDRIIWDLDETVKFKVSDVESFLDDFLGMSKTKERDS